MDLEVPLSEEEAMAGFLKDLEKVNEESARAGLLEGDYKGKAAEVAAMSTEQVREAYKCQSLAVFHSGTHGAGLT